MSNLNFATRKNTNDIDILYEVFKAEEYSFECIQDKESIKTIVDIGAHIGAFTIKALEHFKNAKCISYEPIKENFRFLCVNTISYLNRSDVYNFSVSGDRLPIGLKCSNLKFDNGKINTGSNIYEYEKSDKQLFNNIHINEVQEKIGYIDILKIDCEGGENSIFENIDFEKVKYIFCELHEYGSLIGNDKTLDIIIEKGFQILYHKYVNDKIQNFIAIKV